MYVSKHKKHMLHEFQVNALLDIFVFQPMSHTLLSGAAQHGNLGNIWELSHDTNFKHITYCSRHLRKVTRRPQHAAVCVTGSLWCGTGQREIYYWRQECDGAWEVAMDGEVANIHR